MTRSERLESIIKNSESLLEILKKHRQRDLDNDKLSHREEKDIANLISKIHKQGDVLLTCFVE